MYDSGLQKLLQTAPSPYIPPKLPFDTLSFLNRDIASLSFKATHAIGQYAGFLRSIPNPSLLLTPITTQEAVLSSKLEGTHATLEDVLNHEAGNKTRIEDSELNEILNYKHALIYAMNNISPVSDLDKPDSKVPLTVKIIRKMHEILLEGVRGSTKNPGEFKRLQNYIGGSSRISFTPLPPALVVEYMSNLEKYINYEDSNPLLQAAIIHAQFEMIHPFEDGNGRIGRLLIPLFLYYVGLIPLPTFYMSAFFEKNRDIYIKHLADISSRNDWRSWIQYFLEGVIMQSDLNTKKAINILRLYESFKNTDLKSYYFIKILDFVFQHPIFNARQIVESKDIKANKQTVYNILRKMTEADIITTHNQNRNKTYICTKLLSIVNVL